MEVDSGATFSVIGENQLSMWGSPLLLQPSPVKLQTFTGEVIIPKGEAEVKVEYGGQTCRLPLLVTPGKRPALLGRNWSVPELEGACAATPGAPSYRWCSVHEGRTGILQELHLTLPGVSHMKALARSYMYWQGIDKDIERLVPDCATCQEHRNVPQSMELQPWEWPDKPWSRLHA